ncbi:tetratricopeptide repeat protein [Hyphomicrobium sp. D-2]|uniref:tetratricopeptide repeat protein n=1 Tax=Hyphomicrobium sp. D-2 TaxID=3041621 RepID=UPI002457E7ED|nr:tetratricopeptide repeat protein [Hyphomicrobium sp. D-2]MDH4980978.1 tetratricopeptide repeat protein [Hyphomicrobium sp. D-2]
MAALTASLMLGACGQTLQNSGGLLSTASSDAQSQQQQRPQQQAQQGATAQPGIDGELLKATNYWAKAYAENPRDLKSALSYARNLKAMNEKRRAMAVLQQVSLYHGQNRDLASEYGRLALELDQVKVAKQVLAIADDPSNPDWRVISARGAVLAKEGDYTGAIPYFERALTFAPDQPSVMSNLALAHAMNGDSDRAEGMLRQAAASDAGSPKIRQNLALVLGLQGKYEEAQVVAARDMPVNKAAENAEYLRQVVMLEPKPMPAAPGSAPDNSPWSTGTQFAAAPPAPAAPAARVTQVTHAANQPPQDLHAKGDTGWVVDSPMPRVASAPPAPSRAQPVMSVSEMAAQFRVENDSNGWATIEH